MHQKRDHPHYPAPVPSSYAVKESSTMPHPDLAIVTGGQIIPATSQEFPRLYHVALDVVHVVRARWYSQASFLGPASSTSSYPYTCRARTSFVGRSVPYLLFLSERRSPIAVTASVGVLSV